MPRIRLSTRTIQPANLPNRHLPSGFREGVSANYRAIDARLGAARSRHEADMSVVRAIDAAIVGADRLKNLIDRRAEKDADEAVTKWETAMLGGIEGTVGQDGRRHGGIAQKSWQDYEGTEASPITDLGDIEKRFQSSDDYKSLSGLAREKFNRRVMARRAQYLGTANRIYDRHRIARTQFYDAQADAVGERKIATAALSDDATFEAVAREETFRKMGRKFRSLMENPEVVDAPGADPSAIRWKDYKAEAFFNGAVLGDLRKISIGRVAQMAESAAMAEPQWVEGRLVTNEEQLKKAEAYATRLALPSVTADGVKLPARITPDEAKALGYKCVQARSQLDDRIRREIAAKSANVLARGDLKTLEAAERQFAATASGFAEGSVGQTAALVAQKEIAKKADERATFEIMNDLAEGKRLTMSDGTTPIFDPKTQPRLARLFPKVRQAFDEKKLKIQTKEFRAAHDLNLLEARTKMMEFAAAGSPQGYLDWLARGVVEKRLSAKDFQTLRDEYRNGWVRGYKGANGQIPKQMQLAGSMLEIMKSKVGFDLAPALERNEDGSLKLDRTGLVRLDEKGTRPELEYERHRSGWFDADEKFTADEAARIVNMSLSMAMNDGMTVAFDPVTGEHYRDGKTHKVNALADFSAFLDHLRDTKKVVTAAEEMARRAAYFNNVGAAALSEDRRRTEGMLKSRPFAGDGKKSDKDDTEEE